MQVRFWLCSPAQLKHVLAASNAEREAWPSLELPDVAGSRGGFHKKICDVCCLPGKKHGFQPAALPPSFCDLRPTPAARIQDATRYLLLEANGTGAAAPVDLGTATASSRGRSQFIRNGTLDGHLCVVVVRSESPQPASRPSSLHPCWTIADQ